MERAPDITIITASAGGGEWLGRTLAACQYSAAMAGLAWEGVVADADGAGAPAEVLAGFPRWRVARGRRAGLRGALARAVGSARGGAVVFCEAGLAPQAPFVGGLAEPLLAADGPAAVSARVVRWIDGAVEQRREGLRWVGGRLSRVVLDGPGPALVAPLRASGYRAEALRGLGWVSRLFEPDAWGDAEWCLRAARSGRRVAHEPAALAVAHAPALLERRRGAAGAAGAVGRGPQGVGWGPAGGAARRAENGPGRGRGR
ncbi:MAG: hypothetical protein SF028_12825, partial [Candidatus Sumerlaeia bacterium]|nr:hypothetical protein [Candidatus Sumerlaeia bacterium]